MIGIYVSNVSLARTPWPLREDTGVRERGGEAGEEARETVGNDEGDACGEGKGEEGNGARESGGEREKNG